jgi:hypothetical protein
MPTRHQWASPYEWFYWKVGQEANPVHLRNMIHLLAGKLDSDQLQDIFEGEMQNDGYFTPFITWHCITCETENEDHPDVTSCPLCSRCSAEYEWEDLHEYKDWEEEHYGVPANRGD